jgi:hypothetical protein
MDFGTDNYARKEINDAFKLVITNCELQKQSINTGLDVAPIYLAGAPGGGKTQGLSNSTKQYSTKDYNIKIWSTHFPLKPYEEMSGIPQFWERNKNDKTILSTRWSEPDIIGELDEASKDCDLLIWLLDDMHLLSSIHMGLLYELLTERKIRDYYIPNNCGMVLAGNFGSNKAGSKTLFSAIINRVSLMNVYTSYNSWKKNFALKNDINYSIVSFLGNERYQQFFHEEEQVDSPWGSPRSWTRLANMISAMTNWYGEISDSDCLVLSQGHVSKNAASEFFQYYKILNKFDIDDILRNSKSFKLPNDTIDKYALAYSLCNHLGSIKDRKSINKSFAEILLKYIYDVPDLGTMIVHELLDMERIMNKRSIYLDIQKEIAKIDPNGTSKLLEELSGV